MPKNPKADSLPGCRILLAIAIGLLAGVFPLGASEESAAESEPGKLPWSFAPLQKQELPQVKDKSWSQSRLDHFVLAGLEKNNIKPTPAADARTLLRRLSFDLTGLPPSMDDVGAFRHAHFEEKVNDLLDSPHYGERWGRHWLDLSRYTDTTAKWLKLSDAAWHYRDWVVKALNDDVPYDQFIIRQLATDLLSETSPKDNAALGFFGLSPKYWKELQLSPETIRTTVADEWEEHVDALGRTFLGLTLACARCHDHKTDPISTADYYAVAGVFANVRATDVPTISPELFAPVLDARNKVATLEKQLEALKKKKPKPDNLEAEVARLTGEIGSIKSSTPHYSVPMVNGIDDAALFVRGKEGGFGTMLDFRKGEARELSIHRRGDPNELGEEVSRRFLTAFPGPSGEPRKLQSGSGRLELAKAIVEDARPLVARVMVNRVWRQHFGRGLVETPSDFGITGDIPSHPDLLDDLAWHFVENGWSLKWLHRAILNSATWQQHSIAPKSEKNDPENRLFGRMTRRRLEVEIWRDAMLQASGNLDLKVGGPAIDLNGQQNKRRTIYGKVHRRDLNKMLQVHDFPDPTAHSPARSETTTPLQALFAMNGPLVLHHARELAKLLGQSEDPVGLAYTLLFQRNPSEDERKLGEQFLQGGDDRLWRYAQALLASNEFLYVD